MQTREKNYLPHTTMLDKFDTDADLHLYINTVCKVSNALGEIGVSNFDTTIDPDRGITLFWDCVDDHNWRYYEDIASKYNGVYERLSGRGHEILFYIESNVLAR